MKDRSKYYAEWKAKKLAEDPDYFRRIQAKHRAKRLAEDPEAFKRDACERVKRYYRRNADKINAKSAERRKANPEKYRELDRKRNASRPPQPRTEKRIAYEKEWLARNAESRKKTYAKHRKKFGAKRAANTAARRCAMLKRTPKWADMDAINFFYECRPEGCHVDHVIPLLGENISGLHVAENLQWLPAKQNLVKSNSF